MSDTVEQVSLLRERVEAQERELGAAVQDLKDAAQRAVEPVAWLRSPLTFVAGGLLIGWWLGSRGHGHARRYR